MAGIATKKVKLTGLPRRLVQDGILDEQTIADAAGEAKSKKSGLVAYLIDNNLADAARVAVAASHEFGVPVLDLDAFDLDLDAVRAVDQQLIQKHRVLPLVMRGKRIYVAVSDPTNLQALDEIKF